jgi:hypothetical protein
MSAHDYLIRNGYLPAPKGKKISYQSMLVLLDNYAKTSRNYNNGNLIPISDFLRCVYIFESDKISHTLAGNLLAFYIEFISWPKYKSMSLDELSDFMSENCFWISKHISANKP